MVKPTPDFVISGVTCIRASVCNRANRWRLTRLSLLIRERLSANILLLDGQTQRQAGIRQELEKTVEKKTVTTLEFDGAEAAE